MLEPFRAVRALLASASVVLVAACGASSGSTSSDGGSAAPTSAVADSGAVVARDSGAFDAGATSSFDATSGSPAEAGVAEAGNGGCLAVGSSCSSKNECCSDYCAGGKCACNSNGYACTTDADCCAGLSCYNGLFCADENPDAVVTCQSCGTDAGTCPGGNVFCQRAGSLFDDTFCAQDCTTNAQVCPPDMTCTAINDDDGNPTGKSGCIPNSATCSAADGGAMCDVACAGTGSPCPCAGYTCETDTNNVSYCLQ